MHVVPTRPPTTLAVFATAPPALGTTLGWGRSPRGERAAGAAQGATTAGCIRGGGDRWRLRPADSAGAGRWAVADGSAAAAAAGWVGWLQPGGARLLPLGERSLPGERWQLAAWGARLTAVVWVRAAAGGCGPFGALRGLWLLWGRWLLPGAGRLLLAGGRARAAAAWGGSSVFGGGVVDVCGSA